MLSSLLVLTLTIGGCKKSEQSIAVFDPNDLTKSSKSSISEEKLKEIQSNFKLLAASPRNLLNKTLSSLNRGQVEPVNITKSVQNLTDSEYLDGELTLGTDQGQYFLAPEGGEVPMGGKIVYFNWIVAYKADHLYDIISMEKCNVWLPSIDWYFNSIVHENSRLEGVFGPLSWHETSNLQYIGNTGPYAYVACTGALALVGIGARTVSNERYVASWNIPGM